MHYQSGFITEFLYLMDFYKSGIQILKNLNCLLYYNFIIIISCEFFTPALADGPPLEFK